MFTLLYIAYICEVMYLYYNALLVFIYLNLMFSKDNIKQKKTSLYQSSSKTETTGPSPINL